jgi:hypothetical protein
VIKRDAWTDLAPVVDKGKFDLVIGTPENICDLCGNPTLFFVCEPDPGSLGVNVLCHGPGGRRDDCSTSLLPLITDFSHGHLIRPKSDVEKKILIKPWIKRFAWPTLSVRFLTSLLDGSLRVCFQLFYAAPFSLSSHGPDLEALLPSYF